MDCGNFDWSNGKFPGFTESSDSYHGLSFWESFGPGSDAGNIAFAVKARAEGLRDWGCSLSPFNAFLLLQGSETLSLRLERVLSNSQRLAEWLELHPKVERVNYPGLKGNPNYQNGKRYLRGGFGGVLSFDIKCTRESASEFVN